MPEARFPVIGISYCRNTEENSSWCKEKDEIDLWLKTHPQYFVYQVTRFLDSIWEDNPIINEHPYYGDKKSYFPTLKSTGEYNYGPIEVDPSQRDN